MDADGAGFLRQTHHGSLDLAGSHDQVGELIDDDDDIRQVTVAVMRIEPPGGEFLVVFGDIARPGLLTEFQTVVHLRTERVERIDRLAGIGDDRIVLRFHLGEEMPFDLGVEREFDHLGVDHHELQLRGVFAVEQRGDDRIESHRLTLTRGTRDQQVRHLGQIEDVVFVLDRAADHHRKLGLRLLKTQRTHGGVHRHHLLVAVGDREWAR